MIDELIKVDLKVIKSFIAIVECHGVTAAQTKLHLSPSVISGHLKQFEKTLGMQLCERGRSGFQLTDDGVAVYESCLTFHQSIENFKHQLHYIRQLDSSRGGLIRLSMADQLPKFFYNTLQTVISNTYNKTPNIHFSINIQSPEKMTESLLKNETDIGIGYFGKFSPLLNFTPAFLEQQVICCGDKHPLFNASFDYKNLEINKIDNMVTTNKALTLTELENDYMWIKRGYEVEHTIQSVVPKYFSATTYHMEATAQLILAGCHLGYLPYSLAEQFVKENRMQIIMPEKTSYQVQHYWAYRSQMKPYTQQFLGQMQHHLTRH